MMDNFSQILWWMPINEAPSSNSHFRAAAPFKVQVNFDIPIFEGQIGVVVVYKWLDMLEGYFLVHCFSENEKITFALLKVAPHVKDWWETYCNKKVRGTPCLQSPPLGTLSKTLSRNNITPWGDMRTNTYSGSHYDNKGTKMCMRS